MAVHYDSCANPKVKTQASVTNVGKDYSDQVHSFVLRKQLNGYIGKRHALGVFFTTVVAPMFKSCNVQYDAAPFTVVPPFFFLLYLGQSAHECLCYSKMASLQNLVSCDRKDEGKFWAKHVYKVASFAA